MKTNYSFGMTFWTATLFSIGSFLTIKNDLIACLACGLIAEFFIGANLYKNYMIKKLLKYGLTKEEIKAI